MSNPFYFKQFSIHQDQCAMKVGTDGVLLGCFVNGKYEPGNILDIGTGTGLLALMMAQKFPQSRIVAIEIDEAAATQATQNVQDSQWKNNVLVKHQSLQEFFPAAQCKYNLIVCNPPYFKEANKTKGNNVQHPSPQRAKARFTNYLPFEELVAGVKHLLSSEGSFYVVLPVGEANGFKTQMQKEGFYLTSLMEITGREGTAPNRWLMQWKKQEELLKQSALLMYHTDKSPTEAYIEFTRDFYLWRKYDQHPNLKL